jgi:steroid delta-isomerase-like uncharacterized protein
VAHRLHAWYAFADTGEATERIAMDHTKAMQSTYDRINAGDVDGFGELLADGFVEHQGAAVPPTKQGTLEFFRALLTSFPDMQMNVDDLMASGDKTVARVTVRATHRADFMGVAPTGKRVEVQLIDIMRFDDAGLVCEHWGVVDMLSLLQQIGAVPTGPPA